MSAKGFPKTPGSGRKKGTPNKKTSDLEARCVELGVSPWDFLLHCIAGNWKALGYEGPTVNIYSGNAVNVEDTIPIAIRAKCAATACEYLYAKRKSVEGTVTLEAPDRPLEYVPDHELEKL